MFWLILNLWSISFIFLGSIIYCLDSTYKNLQNINDNLESIRKELTLIRNIYRVATILDKKLK